MKKYTISLFLVISSFISACTSVPQNTGSVKSNDVPGIQTTLNNSSTKLENNTSIIDNGVVNIKHHTETAADAHPDIPELQDYRNLVVGETEKIEQANNSNKEIVAEIKDSSKSLDSVNKEIAGLHTKISNLESEKAKIQDKAVQNIYSYLGVVFAIGLATVIAGAALAFFFNPRTGLFVSALGLIGLGVAAAATYYLKVVAIFSMAGVGVIIVGVISYTVYVAIRERKATTQTVELVETIKKKLPEEKKVEIFGTNSKPGLAHEIIKSDTSKKIIDRIRKSKKKSPDSSKSGDTEIEENKTS